MGVDSSCLFFYTSCFVECSFVAIQIKHEINDIIGGFLYGSFNRSSDVNEKPSYMGTYQQGAIWYAEEAWWVGSIDNLGKAIGVIYTKDDFDRLDFKNIVWNYWNGNEWKTAGTYDVSFECKPGEFRNEQD